MMDATGMIVVGHGVDLIEVARIERMLAATTHARTASRASPVSPRRSW
jgi:phosphopantetheinyl transferase (holo-ACP synthase)